MEHNYSPKWKKRGDRTGLIRNALLKSMGYTDEDIEKPIIGIINTWAETNPGHLHFRQLSEAVKRGVISKSRHDSYVSLYEILKNKHKWDK